MERATRYDAIIATLVGVCALVVSAYTAYIQRQQVRAQVYPIVQLRTSASDENVHVTVANKGSGPALIRDVRISIDGQPIRNWAELIARAVGKGHESRNISYASFGTSVVGAGEQIQVFSFSCNRTTAPKPVTNDPGDATTLANIGPSDETCARLMRLLIDHVSTSICYCSTLDECLLFSDAAQREPTTTETRHCPARSADSFQ